MRIRGTSNHVHRRGPGQPRLPRRWKLRVFLVAAGILAVGLWAGTRVGGISSPESWLGAWAESRGHGVYGQTSLRELLPSVPGRWMASTDVSKLVIDIGFTDMQALYAKRAQALATRTLIQEEDDLVPASIRHGSHTTRVRLRLKGDFTDHLDTKKWSFRVHVRDGDHIFGMRRFSLQHPRVRGYQGEALFFDYLRRIGLLAPRYFFVHVTINGNEVGIMALEEHFSKELLESQGRREGVIAKFDESLFWEERVTRGINTWLTRRVTSYTNSPIDVFRRGSVLESPNLTRDLQSSVGLLRGFVEGKLSASQVFDVAATARFIAACEIWYARHALYWNNLRFYFDPVSLRFEPIAFDAAVHTNPDTLEVIARQEPIISKILDDSELFVAYEAAVRELSQQLVESELLGELGQVQQQHLSVLREEYVLLEPYPLDRLQARAGFLRAIDVGRLDASPVTEDVYPELVQAFLIAGEDGPYLELGSIVPHEVEVVSARWVGESGSHVEPFETVGEVDLPLTLPATPVLSVPRAHHIAYRSPLRSDLRLELLTRIPGQDREQTLRAVSYRAPAERHPLSALADAHPLAAHSFLEMDAAGAEVRVLPGTWVVDGSIVVPRGMKLSIGPGTTLRFEEDAVLVVSGPTEFEGTAERPVVLAGTSRNSGPGGWQGVVVLQEMGSSRWSHVRVRGTTGVARSWWTLTGGVTFQNGAVDLTSCDFSGNRGEDALNLISTRFALDGISISETLSDGLDVDFGQGTIRDITFRDIGSVSGGDALDVSGARLDVETARFENVRDKALSIGERSTVHARDVRIHDAGVGAAAKDGSLLDLRGATIDSARFVGLMAYVKKPVFGPGRLEAHDVTFVSIPEREQARVQTGSYVAIDGNAVATEDLDVDALYDTIMRPGLRQ